MRLRVLVFALLLALPRAGHTQACSRPVPSLRCPGSGIFYLSAFARTTGTSDFLNSYFSLETGYAWGQPRHATFGISGWAGNGLRDLRYGVKARSTRWFAPDFSAELAMGSFYSETHSSIGGHAITFDMPPEFVGNGRGPGLMVEAWLNAGPFGVGAHLEAVRSGNVTNLIGSRVGRARPGTEPVSTHLTSYIGFRARNWPAFAILGALVLSRFFTDERLLPCCANSSASRYD